MTMTVAGGSFDLPRPAAATTRVDTAKRDRWLRYGLGVSIAGLLIADTIALANISQDDAARRAARAAARAEAAEAAAAATPAETGIGGAGFAALDIPADLAAFAPVVVRSGAPAPATPTAALAAPTAGFTVFTAPRLTTEPLSGPIGGNQGSSQTPANTAPDAPAENAGVLEQVVTVVETVPEAGQPMAEVIVAIDEAEPVTEAVEPEVLAPVAPVAEAAPAASDTTSAVTEAAPTSLL